MTDYEKLGAFYLGRRYDAARGETTPEMLLHDAKDPIRARHGTLPAAR